jgi:hypothetical protein
MERVIAFSLRRERHEDTLRFEGSLESSSKLCGIEVGPRLWAEGFGELGGC